jgi:hypothetical protein
MSPINYYMQTWDLFVLFLSMFRYTDKFFGEKYVDGWDTSFNYQCYKSIHLWLPEFFNSNAKNE